MVITVDRKVTIDSKFCANGAQECMHPPIYSVPYDFFLRNDLDGGC